MVVTSTYKIPRPAWSVCKLWFGISMLFAETFLTGFWIPVVDPVMVSYKFWFKPLKKKSTFFKYPNRSNVFFMGICIDFTKTQFIET